MKNYILNKNFYQFMLYSIVPLGNHRKPYSSHRLLQTPFLNICQWMNRLHYFTVSCLHVELLLLITMNVFTWRYTCPGPSILIQVIQDSYKPIILFMILETERYKTPSAYLYKHISIVTCHTGCVPACISVISCYSCYWIYSERHTCHLLCWYSLSQMKCFINYLSWKVI